MEDINNIFLSVIVPAYNEEKDVIASVSAIDHFFGAKSWPFEILVVDDGSTDKTSEAVSMAMPSFAGRLRLLSEKANRGKGYALRRGMLEAAGRYLLFTDVDLSTPLEEFNKMLPLLDNGTDVVIGSRRLKGSNIVVHQPWYREFLGGIFYKIVFAIFLKGITDTNCGFKVYKNAAAKLIYSKLTIDRWGFDVEALYIAQKYRLKIAEVPVRWLNDAGSRVSVISAAVNTLRELAQIKLNDWRGKY